MSNILGRTVYAFTVAMLICAATYETGHAAPIAHRHSHPYIVIPLTRQYGPRPYWWPQGEYHWSFFGVPERWGFWCEGAGSYRISC
jgi:hypothetical protein